MSAPSRPPLQRPDHRACESCQAQVKGDRQAAPHRKLDHAWSNGNDFTYECQDCGAELFHSTDLADFGWQYANT